MMLELNINQENELFDIITEAKKKNYLDGHLYNCNFKQFKEGHQKRPGIIINIEGVGVFVMPVGTIHNDKWKKYKENLLIQDRRVEKLKNYSYANTGNTIPIEKRDIVEIYGEIGPLTLNDYNRIVKPVRERIINQFFMGTMMGFESAYIDLVGPEGIYDLLQ